MTPLAGLGAFAHPGEPNRAWHAPVGPAVLYWTLTVAMLLFVVVVLRLVRRDRRRDRDDPTRIEGLADLHQVRAAAGEAALLARRPASTSSPPRSATSAATSPPTPATATPPESAEIGTKPGWQSWSSDQRELATPQGGFFRLGCVGTVASACCAVLQEVNPVAIRTVGLPGFAR